MHAKFNRTRLAPAVLLAVGMVIAADSAAALEDRFDISGDWRVSWQNTWRDDRDASESDSDVFATRLRLRLDAAVHGNFSFRARLAGTFEEDGNETEFFIRSQRQSPTAIRPGSITLDEAYLRWRSDSRATELRIGRQGHSIRLPLIVDRSLDRDTAVNVDIGWQDGIRLIRKLAGGWKADLFTQYNGHDGNGIANRGPTDFRDSDSRVSYYAGIQNDEVWGPVFFRQLGLNWYPDTLAPNGLADLKREDYLTASAKLAAGWEVGRFVGADGTRFILAGELGRTFEQPTNATMRIGTSGDADAWAWQLGADLRGFVPKHNMGILYGRVQAAWLITPGFRENESYLEARYIFNITDAIAWEVRVRKREELDSRIGAARQRRDVDLRTRLTWRF